MGYQIICLVVSLTAVSLAWLFYRDDEKYHSTCVDSMIEKIEELEAAAEEGQNNG